MKSASVVQTLSLVLLLAAGTAAADEQSGTQSLHFDCAKLQLPSQQVVSRAFGINNFSKAYGVRGPLLQIAKSRCLREASEIQLSEKAVAQKASDESPL